MMRCVQPLNAGLLMCAVKSPGMLVCRSSSFNSGAIYTGPQIREKIGSFMAAYEQYIGVAEVKQAQDNVIQAESVFLRAQAKRRDMQVNLNETQARLRDLHSEIAKTSRGEDRYLTLVTEEHRVLRDESRLVGEYRLLEKEEHALFSAFSGAVRTSHEKERAQSEKTKYWSVIGSAIGAGIGIVGTSLNNWLKMRELRSLVTRSTDTPAELQREVAELTSSVQGHHQQLAQAISSIQEMFSGEQIGTLQGVNGNTSASRGSTAAQQLLDQLRAQLSRLEQLQSQLEVSSCSWQPVADSSTDGDGVRLMLVEHERRVERRLIEASTKLALTGVACGVGLAALLAMVFGR